MTYRMTPDGYAVSEPDRPLAVTPPLQRRQQDRDTVFVRLPESDDIQRRTVEVRPEEPFRPFALLLWGTTEATKVRDIITGAESQMLSTIPGCLFEAEIPFEEFLSLTFERRPGDAYPALTAQAFRKVGLIFRMDLPAVEVGAALQLHLDGGYAHGVFLGDMVRSAVAVEAEGSTDFVRKPLPIPSTRAFDEGDVVYVPPDEEINPFDDCDTEVFELSRSKGVL